MSQETGADERIGMECIYVWSREHPIRGGHIITVRK
jgi:hypothetical protein